MVRSTISDERVIAAVKKDFVPVLVDFDNEKELVKQHRIREIPTIVWARPDGTDIEHTLETTSVDDLLLDMEDALATWQEEQDDGGE